jgi:hypothetical protein
LTLEELQQREAIWTAAMEANAEEGSEENMLVAEGLERILRRTTRRIKGISSGKMQGSRLIGVRRRTRGMGTLNKSGVPTYLVQGYESIGCSAATRWCIRLGM